MNVRLGVAGKPVVGTCCLWGNKYVLQTVGYFQPCVTSVLPLNKCFHIQLRRHDGVLIEVSDFYTLFQWFTLDILLTIIITL